MTLRIRSMMYRCCRMAVIVGLLLGVVGATPALAEDPALAKQLYTEARALMKEGRIRESLEKLKAAHEAFPDDAILVSIANRHLELGEPEEASQVLGVITSTRSVIKKQVKRLRREVEAKLAEPVVVTIRTDVEASTVSIDGGAPRELPARLQLPRGKHVFLFKAAQRADLTVEKVLKGSLEVPLEVNLSALPGRYRVALDPAESLGDTKIIIDGRNVILSPEERRVPVTEPRELPPGKYKVSCIRGFEERADAALEVKTGEVAVATCYFKGSPATSVFMDMDRQTLAWSSAAGAVVSLALGVGYYMSYEQDLEDYPPPRYEIESTKPLVSGLFFATSAGLSGLSYWLFTSDGED